MNKVLYFEGAGWSDADINKETIGNCRIRTAFTNDKGKDIYLEMETGRNIYNKKNIVGYGLYISYVFHITDDKDDCNNSRIPYSREDLQNNYTYTKEDILKWINQNLNCSFDTVEVLPDLGGYRVHGHDRTYNMMENYNYSSSLIEKRKVVYDYFYELEQSEGKEYPNFTLWVDDKDVYLLHLLRHFNGYNKHWSIRIDIDDWKNSIQETKLGKYGC